jgi:hypothetical protein
MYDGGIYSAITWMAKPDEAIQNNSWKGIFALYVDYTPKNGCKIAAIDKYS